MSRPTLPATFQPQAWIDDHALDAGPLERFDAAEAILGMTAEQVRWVARETHKLSGRDLDVVAEAQGLVGPGAHNGPFNVSIEPEDLWDFLVRVGITDLDTLTDGGVNAARENWESMASPSP